MERTQQRINEQIRTSPVRVILEDGTQLGVIPTSEAMDKAREMGFDLVEVAPQADPPVCRVMDYGKFKYQQKKKKEKGHTHQVKNKEIRLRPKIGEHDMHFKVDKARGFLKHRDKVIVSVVFRGRENAHPQEGFEVAKKFAVQLDEVAKVEQGPSLMGRRITMTLTPR